MNSSLQPFIINSTIITNQAPSHHNYCEACWHLSCHPAMTSLELLIGYWLGVAVWLVTCCRRDTGSYRSSAAVWGNRPDHTKYNHINQCVISPGCLWIGNDHTMTNDIQSKIQFSVFFNSSLIGWQMHSYYSTLGIVKRCEFFSGAEREWKAFKFHTFVWEKGTSLLFVIFKATMHNATFLIVLLKRFNGFFKHSPYRHEA